MGFGDFSFKPEDQFRGRPKSTGRRAVVKARVDLDVKDGIARAVELGVYESEQAFVERAVLREYEEQLVPAVLTGDYDKGSQLSRRLNAMAERASKAPSAAAVAEKIIAGLRQLASNEDTSRAQQYIEQIEDELKQRSSPWAAKIQGLLNAQSVWTELRRR